MTGQGLASRDAQIINSYIPARWCSFPAPAGSERVRELQRQELDLPSFALRVVFLWSGLCLRNEGQLILSQLYLVMSTLSFLAAPSIQFPCRFAGL